VEVIAEDSADYQAVDDAFALDGAVELKAAHIYEVRFAQQDAGRWIDEVIREIDRD
jgi:hypothetical protein